MVPSKILSDYERGSIEMLVDSEGSLQLNLVHELSQGKTYETFRPILSISNTNQRILEKAQGMIGGKIHNYRAKNPRWKMPYVLVLNSNGLRWLLPQLKLTVKENHRLLLLEALPLLPHGFVHGKAIKRDRSRLYEIRREIMANNKRGPA